VEIFWSLRSPPTIKQPLICHHWCLSGHIRPQCSLHKAQRSKVKKDVQRQANFGTRPQAQYQAPSIRLHGIKFQGTRPDDVRLFSINGINRDLFLPIRMENPRLTNQGNSWRSCRRWRMINSIESCLYGCRVWYNGWIIRWSLVNNDHMVGRHGSERR
jgi:hypothetical protein